MSMCFLYDDVLYADCFQIHDYKNFAPSLTDNKIFVSESGKVIIAIMGNVPENIPDILERLERGHEVWKSDIKAKKDLDSSTLTFDQIIMNIDVDMLAIFRTTAKKYFSLVTAAGCGADQNFSCAGSALRAYALRGGDGRVPALYRTGAAPDPV